MKAIIKCKINIDREKYQSECQISKDKNKLILEFSNKDNYVPWPLISNGKFNIKICPTEEETFCGDCDTCLTPICYLLKDSF